MKYSMEDKLAGKDLHGLPCRIPKPTPEQEKCSHTKWTEWDDGYEDWDGNWREEWKRAEVCIMEDIEGTNNIRCPKCGYTRRY